MSWMLGVRIRDGRDRGSAYRSAASTPLTIEVRNPPVLSVGASVLGVAFLALGGWSFLLAAEQGAVIPGLRTLAPMVAGMLVAALGLGALRWHTRILVEGDRLVVARARDRAPVRHALLTVRDVEAVPVTGDVRLLVGGERVVLVSALLPEQAALVASALARVLPHEARAPERAAPADDVDGPDTSDGEDDDASLIGADVAVDLLSPFFPDEDVELDEEDVSLADVADRLCDSSACLAVDWRGVLAEELPVIEEQLAALGLDLRVSPRGDDGCRARLEHRGRSVSVRYRPADEMADFDDVIVAIHELLDGAAEYRALRAFDGSDTWTYALLSASAWKVLEARHPALVASLFQRVT